MQRNITSKTSPSKTNASRRSQSSNNDDEKESLHRIPGTISGTSSKNTPSTINVGPNSSNGMIFTNGSSSSTSPPNNHENEKNGGGTSISSNSSSSLYYNNDDINHDESRGIILSENKSHGDENPTLYYDDEINRLKQDIQFWNRFLTIGNTSVLLFSVLVLVLYFTTDVFPKEQQQQPIHSWNVTEIFDSVSNRCLDETIMKENDIGTFMECATFCSDVVPCCDGDENSNDDAMKNITSVIQSTEPFRMNESSICQKTNDETQIYLNNNEKKNNINHFPKQQCYETCNPIINTTYMTYFSTYMQRICNKETIEKSKTAFKLCEEKCIHFDCCFNLDESQNCLADAGSMCGSFFDACVHVKENAAMFGYGVGPQLLEPSD